jgi:hypothetical protein
MFNTKEDFNSAYRANAERWGRPSNREPIVLHYHRCMLYPMMERRAKVLVERLEIMPGEKVLIIGCGFGWTVEALNDYCVSIGTETSTYILDNMHTSEEPDIVAAIEAVGLDASTGEGLEIKEKLLGDGVRTRAVILNENSYSEQSRNIVRQTLGGIDYVITEDVLPAFDDQNAKDFAAHIRQYAAPVYHLVTPLLVDSAQDAGYNWKTVTQWKEIVGDDQYIMPVGELQVY